MRIKEAYKELQDCESKGCDSILIAISLYKKIFLRYQKLKKQNKKLKKRIKKDRKIRW